MSTKSELKDACSEAPDFDNWLEDIENLNNRLTSNRQARQATGLQWLRSRPALERLRNAC